MANNLQAQVISQMVLVGLLLQYLLAPKIAETMRQKAIMLCRALTTTETQALKKERVKLKPVLIESLHNSISLSHSVIDVSLRKLFRV